MSRYLPFVKPAPSGRVVETGPTPAPHRLPLDDPTRPPTWRSWGHSGSGSPGGSWRRRTRRG